MINQASLPDRFFPLNTSGCSLALSGGKGLNLCKLKQAGFPVPEGFIIPTTTYQEFVRQNQLDSSIQSALQNAENLTFQELEDRAEIIQKGFLSAQTSPSFKIDLLQAVRWLGADSLAVRSSATAEDLPGTSFAGLQETFLNVQGDSSVLKAVKACWASLWTARAIRYRNRNNIPHSHVLLAVVIQELVPAEASGVMFTANPVSGLRSQIVIDATRGLGEALVSGQVDPDHYIYDRKNAAIVEKTIGKKAIVTRAADRGGVETSHVPSGSGEQAIPDEVIRKLAGIGEQIETLYRFPQDIEWAYLSKESPSAEQKDGDINERLFVLQARPITSLYPLPDNISPDPVCVFFSFGAVQGIMDPITPLGKDAIRLIFAGGASLFGMDVNHRSQKTIKAAGERLWVDFTGIIRHPLASRLFPRVFSAIEPGSRSAVKTILADTTIGAGSGALNLRAIWKAARFGIGMARRILRTARKPEESAELVQERIQVRIHQFRQQSLNPDPLHTTLQHAVYMFRQIIDSFIFAVPEIGGALLAGILPLVPLTRLSEKWTGSSSTALKITRGLPHNVTTGMDLALWQAASAIREDPTTFRFFRENSSADLARAFKEDGLPGTAHQEIRSFLETYGMRGLGEIDIGRPRWRENPIPVFQTLKSYLLIEEKSQAPDAVFKRSGLAAEEAILHLQEAARSKFAGVIKARLVKELALRVRCLGGIRESPKFYIIQKMGIIREELLEAGAELVENGILEKQDDLFYLCLDELEMLVEGKQNGLKTTIVKRRQQYVQEQQRQQIPRLLLSDGRAFYEGITSTGDQNLLTGSPVSPGKAEGRIRVVLDPHNADLLPGEILVCPGTDPSWTPLFLAAGGLIMESGGMMTHGAIIAREYGIPAVVGIDRATELLKTGELIRIDGSSGQVERVQES